tara:strand:+ start:930 stop:1229 length:300 start_codon:yes stop_codon:yes gene_type:complete
MSTKKELIEEMEGWRGKNPLLVKEIQKKIRFGQYDKEVEEEKDDAKELSNHEVKADKPSFQDYKDKNMDELKRIAKGFGVKSYYNLKEDELIKKIMEVH